MKPVLVCILLLHSFFVFAQETEYGHCSLNNENKTKIEDCQRQLAQHCEDIPAELKKNCFSEYSQDEFSFAKSCAVDGSKKFISDTVNGLKDMTGRIYSSFTNNKEYIKRVRAEAIKNCTGNKAVKDAQEHFAQIVKNVGAGEAHSGKYSEESRKSTDLYLHCLQEEEHKGKNYGVTFDIPDLKQLTTTLSCMSSKAQVEFGCSIVLPALASGGYGGVKSLLKINNLGKVKKTDLQITNAVQIYENKLKNQDNKLTPAELASFRHQLDLLAAFKNPEIVRRLGLPDSELEGLIQGVIDSDAGKLGSYKALLIQPSERSNVLFNVLKGQDKSPAGKAFQEFMHENGMTDKGLLNQKLSNDQIREVFNAAPAFQGYLHELPGISEAIDDLNRGRIKPEQFKKRIGANIFHNGPKAGFWELFNDTLLPTHMKSSFVQNNIADKDALNNFFENTAFQGERVNDLVLPKYSSPITKEGIIHTNFDRLSQGTSGGNSKIFLEFFNKTLVDKSNTKMGDLKNPSGQNGLTSYRDILIGNPLAKPNPVLSNSQMTAKQFDALSEVINKSDKLKGKEKTKLLEISRASRDRTLAFDDYVKQYADFKTEADGSVSRIILEDSNGKYIGGITKDTPADEAIQLFEKFYNQEELLNGDPMKDLMKPRILTKTEKAAYGLPAPLNYFYCNLQQFKGGKALQSQPSDGNGGNYINSTQSTQVSPASQRSPGALYIPPSVRTRKPISLPKGVRNAQ